MFIWIFLITLVFFAIYLAVTYEYEEPDVLNNKSILPRRKLWSNNRGCILIRSEDQELARKTAKSLVDTNTGMFIRVFTTGNKIGDWPENVKVESVAFSDILPSAQDLVLLVEDRSVLYVEGGLLFLSDPSSMFNKGSMIWLDHTPDKYIVGEGSMVGNQEPQLLESVFLLDKQSDKHAASLMNSYSFQQCWTKKKDYKTPHLLGQQSSSFKGTHRLIGHESDAIILLPGTNQPLYDLEFPKQPWQVQTPDGKLTCDKLNLSCFYSSGKIINL